MSRITRRQLLGRALATSAAAWAGPAILRAPRPDKLRLGVVGVANRGAANLGAVRTENVVALCDVDARYLARAHAQHPQARNYRDFREMLEKEELDACVVSTPDHLHAPVAGRALRKGLHVYCEKPLTHTVREARTLRQLAASGRLVTQMGTQIHAGRNYRRVVEAIRAGAVGRVHTVHVFCSKSWSGESLAAPRKEAPPHLDWDLWLGPAAARPYTPGLHPAEWRRYWDFGGGTLADMGAHYLDLAWWALELDSPATIAARGPELHLEGTPRWIEITWEHREREEAPLTVTWSDGGRRPAGLDERFSGWRNGVLFLGDEGWLIADYGRHEIGPKSRARDFVVPEPSIPDSVGHHREWLEACRAGRPTTTCDFAYSGRLTEALLLGTVAFRSGEKLRWDGTRGVLIDASRRANALLGKDHRSGWEV